MGVEEEQLRWLAVSLRRPRLGMLAVRSEALIGPGRGLSVRVVKVRAIRGQRRLGMVDGLKIEGISSDATNRFIARLPHACL